MHATIQKPLGEIMAGLAKGESVFVVGCGNCAAKAHSGGELETRAMKDRLEAKGVRVTGWAVTPDGVSLCKLSVAKDLLSVQHKREAAAADSFLVLACGQGIHAVIDATAGGYVHAGCDTIFGGETVNDGFITEYCSLCGQCLVEHTGGLCPLTLCAKGLLNGPCGGAEDGKCEVSKDRDCGWHLIYERLKAIGRLDLLGKYHPPRDWSRSGNPRSLELSGKLATFSFGARTATAWSGTDEPPDTIEEGQVL